MMRKKRKKNNTNFIYCILIYLSLHVKMSTSIIISSKYSNTPSRVLKMQNRIWPTALLAGWVRTKEL